MDPDTDDIIISDVVMSLAGRDRGCLYFVIGKDADCRLLANGKNRTLESPKRKKLRHMKKILHPETRVAAKLLAGDKVLNSELRKDLAFISREMQSNALGG